MNYLNDDNMLIIKTESGDEMLYFDDWLQVKYGSDERGVRARLIYEFDGDEDMVWERMEELESQFHDYCEANDLIPELA